MTNSDLMEFGWTDKSFLERKRLFDERLRAKSLNEMMSDDSFNGVKWENAKILEFQQSFVNESKVELELLKKKYELAAEMVRILLTDFDILSDELSRAGNLTEEVGNKICQKINVLLNQHLDNMEDFRQEIKNAGYLLEKEEFLLNVLQEGNGSIIEDLKEIEGNFIVGLGTQPQDNTLGADSKSKIDFYKLVDSINKRKNNGDKMKNNLNQSNSKESAKEMDNNTKQRKPRNR